MLFCRFIWVRQDGSYRGHIIKLLSFFLILLRDNIETIGEHFELLLQQFGYFELVLFYVAIRTNNFF